MEVLRLGEDGGGVEGALLTGRSVPASETSLCAYVCTYTYDANATLERNISVLYNTAKGELARKDRQIADLTARLDRR